MTTWITYSHAAEILGVNRSTISTMIERGDLTSNGRHHGGSLDLIQVETLAEQRGEAASEAERARLQRYVAADERHVYPPDAEHEWLTVPQAADLLGITRQALAVRCRHDQLPHEWRSGRRWIRRDLLDLLKRTCQAQRERSIRRLRPQ